MMIKLLVILLAIGMLAWLLLRSSFKPYPKTKNNKKHQDEIEEMCECACCGVYISQKEALMSNGYYFCSQECLKKRK